MISLRSMLVLCALVSGCTAARAGYFLVDASRTYREAVDAGAAERAPYELTLAHEYLLKAREEDGYSDFGASEKLAKRSIEESRKAIERAGEQGVPLDAAGIPEEMEGTSDPAPKTDDE
jgi:hypothetical protein